MNPQPNPDQTLHPRPSTSDSDPPLLSVLPSPQSAAIPAPKPRTRNGKIARLPYLERDMVNRMLRDHVPHDKIRGALEEHGICVTQRNISNWKTRGGYRDWCLEMDRALEIRLLQDNLAEHLREHDAAVLPEIGLQLAATSLSQFFLKPDTRNQLATEPEKLARVVSMICRLSRHIHTLQKYRDDSAKELGSKYNPESIKRHDENQTEITREVYSAVRLPGRPSEHILHHRNYLPKHWDTPPEPLDPPPSFLDLFSKRGTPSPRKPAAQNALASTLSAASPVSPSPSPTINPPIQ